MVGHCCGHKNVQQHTKSQHRGLDASPTAVLLYLVCLCVGYQRFDTKQTVNRQVMLTLDVSKSELLTFSGCGHGDSSGWSQDAPKRKIGGQL